MNKFSSHAKDEEAVLGLQDLSRCEYIISLMACILCTFADVIGRFEQFLDAIIFVKVDGRI